MSHIIEIPISELVIDSVISLSGRTEKERAENAKELEPMLESGWDISQPGQVFKRNGKWHVAHGFTRVHILRKKEGAKGYFVEVSDDPAKLRTACIRHNSGKPISSVAKGRLFSEMRAGTDVKTAAPGDPILPAMSDAEIAKEVGISANHVRYCCILAESTPEIQQLMEDGRVNGNVVYRASQLAREDGQLNQAKQLKAIKAAIRHAEQNGKGSASMTDLEAIQLDVFPLKAAKNTPPQAPATPEPRRQEPRQNDDAPEPAPKKEYHIAPDPAQSSMNLGSSDSPPKQRAVPGRSSLAEKFYTILCQADVEEIVSAYHKDLFAQALVDAGATIEIEAAPF